MEWPVLGTLLVSCTGLVTAVAAFYKNRADAKVSQTSEFDRRYEAIYDQIQDHLLVPLGERVNSLQEEVEALTGRFVILEGKFRVAVVYIRQLRSTHPDPQEPPHDLAEDL